MVSNSIYYNRKLLNKNLLTSLTKDQSKTRKLLFYVSSANCNLVSYILLPFERICVDEKGIWGFKMMGK